MDYITLWWQWARFILYHRRQLACCCKCLATTHANFRCNTEPITIELACRCKTGFRLITRVGMSLLIMHGKGVHDVCLHDVGVFSVGVHGADVFEVGLHKKHRFFSCSKGRFDAPVRKNNVSCFLYMSP
jgi:hypothetical protein